MAYRSSFAWFLALALSQPALAQWAGNGPVTTFDDVGIGTSSPTAPLTVINGKGEEAILAENSTKSSYAITARTFSGSSGAIHASAEGSSNFSGTGIFAESDTLYGRGIEAHVTHPTGPGWAVKGQSSSPNAYSGYFSGGRFAVWSGPGAILVNREFPAGVGEVFSVHTNSNSWAGMSVESSSIGKPYYGYAGSGALRAYHHFNNQTDKWHLTCGGTRLTVQGSDGYVGIGTTTPSYRLHVNGSAGKPGGGSWSNASDLRLKKDVVQLEGALDRLLAVRGVSFEYEDPDAIGELHGERLGVVAQEVEAAFPDWVEEGADGYKRVTFRGFEGVTIEALRELRDRNAELEAQVAAQAVSLESLLGRLAVLEASAQGH